MQEDDKDRRGGQDPRGQPLKRARAAVDVTLDLATDDMEVVWEWITRVMQVNRANNWYSESDQKHGVRMALDSEGQLELTRYDVFSNRSAMGCLRYFMRRFW